MQDTDRGGVKIAKKRSMGMGIGFLFAVLFLLLPASGVYADQVCSDCHNTGPHIQCDAGNCAACHGNPPTDATAGVNGLIHPYGSEPKPVASGSASPGAHAKHATSSGMNYVCGTCHYDGMSATSERLVGLQPDGSYNGNGILQIGFNIPFQVTSFLTGGTYDGAAGLAYPYEARNGTIVNTGGSKTCSNIYCHNDGTYVSTGVIPAKTSPAWDTTSVPLTCDTCHGYPPSYTTGSPKANSHMTRSHQQTCNFCHYATTTDGATISDPPSRGNHANGVYNLAPDTSAQFNGNAVSFNYTYDAGGGTCTTVSCHGGVTAVWGLVATGNCTACHTNIVQSGSGKNHHSATCETCHGTASWPLHQGATPYTENSFCTTCHTAEATAMKYAQMSTFNCSQCHTVPGVPPVTSGTDSVCSTCHPGGVYDTYATNMHLQNPTAAFGVSKSGLTINVNGSASTCPSGATCSYDFDWGDSTVHGSSITDSHTYGAGGTYTVTLTVSSSTSISSATESQYVTVDQPNSAPAAGFYPGYPQLSFWTVTVRDNSTDADGNMTSPSAITVRWGNGTYSRCAPGGTVSKTYTVAGTYTISLSATDDSGLTSTVPATASVTIATGNLSGTVKNGSGVGVYQVKVTITGGGVTKYAYTNSSGNYSISNVKPGAVYTMAAVKGTTTYATQTWVTSGIPGTVLAGANTVNFTP